MAYVPVRKTVMVPEFLISKWYIFGIRENSERLNNE